jgi:peptidoglycan/xylan/chitin deacetylase (PgdA/CDA1 family)
VVEQAHQLDRGVFTLSLDFELIWGTVDQGGPGRFRRACEIEREVVIDRLLALLAEFEIPATWCIVGHLFLDSCAPVDGAKHPKIVRPSHSWSEEDWFAHDPCGTEATDPIFYGASLIDKIRACPFPQEIGCHSFSHVIFGDQGCSRETATSELAECVRLAQERGVHLRSFAFPRNRVGHLDVLREHGLTCYRGPEPVWYERPAVPQRVKRLGHLADVLTARRPPVVLPKESAPGLWNVPGSMLYFPMHGRRRYIPLPLRVRRAVKGLESAAEERRIFHLWFHPTNLADETERMFAGLRTIFERVSGLRSAGRIAVGPMRSLVPGPRASADSGHERSDAPVEHRR